MNILLIGGNGEFCEKLIKHGEEHSFLTPSKKLLDVRSYWGSDRYFYRYQKSFDYVIHAGAITRPMVIHEDNPTLSIKTNIIGTANMALMCERYNKKLIYISTDYVYPGTDGDYKETDAVKPFTNYGRSKLGGECSVQMYDNHLILRLSMTTNPFPHPKALKDMKKSYMYTDDAAKITLKLLDETGIINVGGESQSVYEFVKKENPDIGFNYLSEISDVNMATDCSMNTTKLKKVINDTII
jgi:dTDP-4-dehydrorhamnose reductase